MTDAEILAELDRIKALPGIMDVSREGGLSHAMLWAIRTGQRSMTRQMASRLERALTNIRRDVEATFSVSLHSGRPSRLENRRQGP